ncbi:uncharacterized mitochondrial protein AtMg00860-like [Aristolochia californica]|uniref:uncharacterized mitochondrial protein AtMg00860-like n=1 Tax=Aristolochia californica TaxID=171875 RepID=UPI0035DDEF20
MPFGLSNAPSTFQALMNEVLKPLLWKYVLVFFDDILIYNATWESHMQHLRTVFQLLRAHHLFLKHFKCSFGAPEVAYLGHVISAAGVKVDSSKIQAVVDWPTPHSATALKGFLHLSGYYRKFIHDYGQLAAPLMCLLKRNAFAWSEAASYSFAQLTLALASAPLLQLQNFEDLFVIECDTSGGGIGAVLQ